MKYILNILRFLVLYLTKSIDYTETVSGGIAISNYSHAPFLTAIYNFKNDFVCNGAMIAKKKVLSSASCLGSYPRIMTYDEDNLKTKLEVHIGNINRDLSYIFEVTQLKHDVKYDYDNFNNDISVLLTTKAISGERIMAITPETRISEPKTGQNVSIFAYGAVKENLSNVKIARETWAVVISEAECKMAYFKIMIDYRIMFCTHRVGGGACQGDEGGPVVFKNGSSDLSKWRLVGVVSFRRGCGYSEYPDIHTRVSKYQSEL